MAYKPAQATPSTIVELIRYLFRELQRVGQEFYSISPQEWVDVTFENSWVNFGAPYDSIQYRKTNNEIELRGLTKSGTVNYANAIFTLPEDFRPVNSHLYAVTSNDLFGSVLVGSGGGVSIGVGSNVWVSLDGIRFSLD